MNVVPRNLQYLQTTTTPCACWLCMCAALWIVQTSARSERELAAAVSCLLACHQDHNALVLMCVSSLIDIAL